MTTLTPSCFHRDGRHSVRAVAVNDCRRGTGARTVEVGDCDSITIATVARTTNRDSVNYVDTTVLQSRPSVQSPVLRQPVCATQSHHHCSAAISGSNSATVATATTARVPRTTATVAVCKRTVTQRLIDCCYQWFRSAHCCPEPIDGPLRLLVQ